MTEAITTPDVTTNEQIGQVADTDNTQTQDINLEENNSSDLTTTTEPTDNNNADATTEVTTTTVADATSTQPNVDELQSRIKEYELRDEEAQRIRDRLNLPKSDPNLLHYDTIEAQINNQSQQQWIELCNRFGVDYTPQGIDKSCQDLEAKDPKAYYQFKAEMDRFANQVTSNKSAIANERKNYEIGSFYNQNKDLLEGSPVVKQMVSNYIQQNYNNMQAPAQELGGLMDAIRTILLEGVEVGKAVSQVEKTKNDKTGVSANSSIVTANASTTNLTTGKKFTRESIDKMSLAEYEKNEKAIIQAYQNGEIE